MTDNEIIKALECCTNCICNHAKTDTECPLVKMSFCKNYLMKESLALINRQKAEIERLHNEVKEKTETITFLKNQATGWSIDFCNLKSKLETAKSEAIKEFAEKLKEELSFGKYIQFDQIDNLVKEVAGEKT